MIPNMRAFDKVRKEMVYATILRTSRGISYVFPKFDDKDPIYMMGSGTNDKTGNEVFEGDVLQCENLYGELMDYVVRWSDFRHYFIGDNDDEMYDLATGKFNEAKIIGNIHDEEVQQ